MSHHKNAIYAGTFDPFTKGHQNIIERALKLFDGVTIVLAKSPIKKPLFTLEQRMEMLRELYLDNDKVSIDSWGGLIVDYAKSKKIHTLIRGLRPTGDFESEFQMSSMNNKLCGDIETVFFMTEGQYYFISSTLVRELHGHGGDISDFVPETILNYLRRNVKKQS